MENLQAEIQERVDLMVDEILVLIQRTATEGVIRAMSKAVSQTRVKEKKIGGRQQKHWSKASPARSPEEIAELCERLYREIEKDPGKPMGFYSQRLDIPNRKLKVPSQKLKNVGRVRSAGQRNDVRYFPMDDDPKQSFMELCEK